MNLFINFWIMCHGVVFSVPILLSRHSALCFLYLITLLNLCFFCGFPQSTLYSWQYPLTVVLADIIVSLESLDQLGFYTYPEILDTILLLILMGFVALNRWYPTMIYWLIWLGLFLLLVDSSDPYFFPLFFYMLGIRL